MKPSLRYRIWRWMAIHVGWFGINDPDDVGPYFELQSRLKAEIAAERGRR